MSRIAPQQRIASGYVVLFGKYGDVSRYARERGVCRQWVYRECEQLQQTLANEQQRRQQCQQKVQELRQQVAVLQEQLTRAVVIDDDKQAEFASVGQARGVSLPDCRELLEVLIPGRSLSVATLGRRTQAAGKQANAKRKSIQLNMFPAGRDSFSTEHAVDRVGAAIALDAGRSIRWEHRHETIQ